MKSLAVHEQEKKLDLDEFFKRVNVPNKQLIQIIHNKVEIVLKSGKKKDQFINKLTTSDITRRINYIKFNEKIKNI